MPRFRYNRFLQLLCVFHVCSSIPSPRSTPSFASTAPALTSPGPLPLTTFPAADGTLWFDVVRPAVRENRPVGTLLTRVALFTETGFARMHNGDLPLCALDTMYCILSF